MCEMDAANTLAINVSPVYAYIKARSGKLSMGFESGVAFPVAFVAIMFLWTE